MKQTYYITDYGVVPNLDALQTDKIQAVFDLCRESGGTVVIPAGTFRTGGLRMWSNTTLHLESGAKLLGSDICEDYPVFPIPEGVELRTDMELIPQQYDDKPWPEYRRAIISVLGGENISIIGEEGSLISGDDCADPHGEEGYRGPHGIFLTNVNGITLRGYTIEDCGNFMHQIDNCQNITARHLVCQGGSDGFHLHCCTDVLIEDCVFHTGDDCIAGINMKNVTIRRCELNTSCNMFRAGGSHILVEDCYMWGPGIYPHGMTVVQHAYTDAVRDKSNRLPREAGRHNSYCLWVHFASAAYPSPEPYHDIVFRRCRVHDISRVLNYQADEYKMLCAGAHLTEMRFEDVEFTQLKNASISVASAEEPLTITLQNVTDTYAEDAKLRMLFLPDAVNTTVNII